MMTQLINILHNESCTLVVADAQGTVHRYYDRGVKPLLTLLDHDPQLLRGAKVADKAVGKAAAACMIVGGVAQVHADVMSQPALQLLRRHGIQAQCDTLVDHIINRSGTDWCPMERASHTLNNPQDIITAIRQTLAKMSN